MKRRMPRGYQIAAARATLSRGSITLPRLCMCVGDDQSGIHIGAAVARNFMYRWEGECRFTVECEKYKMIVGWTVIEEIV